MKLANLQLPIAFAAVVFFAFASPAASQTSAVPPSRSYADFYNRELSKTDRINPGFNLRNYTYDRYFYHNPAVSPYLSLFRANAPLSSTNYYRYVLPEQDRREQHTDEVIATLPGPATATPSPQAGRSRAARPANKVRHSDFYKQFYGLP